MTLTAFLRVQRPCLILRLAAVSCAVGVGLASDASAAVNCSDRFKLTTVATSFDGGVFETVRLTARTLVLEVETFAQWRPAEEGKDDAALSLSHQSLKGSRVALCPMAGSDLPINPDTWKKYQVAIAASLGEGTLVSDQLDTTAGEGVRILGWDTREVRFTTKSPTGEVQAIQHHFVLLNGQVGLRVVLTAPPALFEQALDDARFWLSRVTPSGADAN